jgi:hypothetical protein
MQKSFLLRQKTTRRHGSKRTYHARHMPDRLRRQYAEAVPRLGDLFAAYESKIRGLARRHPITEADVLKPRFRLEHDDRIEIYYAPLDWLRPTARIAIVGITPGKDTMTIAYRTAAHSLAAGPRRPALSDA